MTKIAVRELRNHTAAVLRRAQDGEEIVITVNGEPVAELRQVQHRRRRPIKTSTLFERLKTKAADPGLREDLGWLAGDTTDDLGPIR
jgi:prevent-host-death family protein